MIVLDASVAVDFLLGRGRRMRRSPVPLPMSRTNCSMRRTSSTSRRSTRFAVWRVRAASARSAPARRPRTSATCGSSGILTPRCAARVWALRHELTAYDAAYLALAEALEEPLLMTGDVRLAAVAAPSLGDARVALVA